MSQDNEQMRQTNDASTSTYLPGQILQAHKFRGLTEDGAEAENSRFWHGNYWIYSRSQRAVRHIAKTYRGNSKH